MDLAVPIRNALLGESAITSQLEAYLDSYPIFTRRPVPTESPFPLIVVSSDVALGNQDLINREVLVLGRNISIYGRNDTAAQYRAVEAVARAVRTLFHRNRTAITVAGYSIIDLLTTGPIPAPTDDDQTVGRVVALTIRMTPS